MNGAFYIGAVGLQSQQRALEVIANNIANINTPAFKRSEVRFTELMAGGVPVDGMTMEALEGARADASAPVFTQGELRTTGKAMDVAIEGEGFLELQGPDGRTYLWRGGTLGIGPDGFLTAAETGLPLKAMVSVPREATSLQIGRDGAVRAVMGEGQPAGEEIGRLEVVRARDGALSAAMGGGLYEVSDPSDLMAATPGEDGAGALVQGAVEGSNVLLAEQMVTLMLMQRAFAANAQVLQAGDQLMAIANGLRR
jgi:flagellar basal-body rod protein FlgG